MELPKVETASGRMFDASSAAYVAQEGEDWAVRVQHPQGGYVLISFWHDSAHAESVAADLNGVMRAWALFTAEAVTST